MTKIQDSGGGDRVRMKITMRLLLLMSLTFSAVASLSRQNCAYEAEREELECSVVTLNSQKNVSIASAGHAQQLSVGCTKNGVESVLRANHFGYLPNLRRLQLTGCQIRQIPTLAFSGLSGLTNLALNSELGTGYSLQVSADGLTGLNSLRSLNLSSNNLLTLPKGIFCSLNSLQTLNLSHNLLQDISELGFSANEVNSCQLPIKTLDLSANEFSRVPAKALGQLSKVEKLDLSYNNLNVMDDEALDGMNSLSSLNMANNKLVALPSRLFRKDLCCERLQELYIQENALSGIGPHVLDGLEHLLVLNLSRNDISNEWLGPDTFTSLVRLVALDLSHNRLETLNSALLSPLTSLQLLDLSHNSFKTISGDVFRGQYNLHILKLSHNGITTLHHRAFSGLSVLGSLSLDHNELSFLNEAVLQNCTNLVDLQLNYNKFQSVPHRALAGLSRLKTLDLGENQISNLTEHSLQGLRGISALRLAANGIKDVKSAIFDSVPNLRILNLGENLISKLDQGVFSSIKGLKMLRLDNNKLETINGVLVGQTDLKWLNVSSNKLQWFDYAFIPKGLEFLDISGNQIEELGNYFKLHQEEFLLRTLDASGNQIKKLDHLSLLPNSLQTVKLRGNAIKKVEVGTFQHKQELTLVDLRSNLIKQMQLTAMSVETNGPSPSFFLSDNPFLCSCEMEWLRKINDMSHPSQYPKVQDVDDIECRLLDRLNSSSLVVAPLMNIKPEEFLCQYHYHCFALCKCCDFFACDCRMQCPQGCQCFHDSTWSANVIQCSNKNHLGIPHLIPMDATTIFMDGNNFTGTLASQAFIGRKKVLELYLNNSQIEAISNQTFNGLTELEVLHLESNKMKRLEGSEFGNLTSLKQLFLQDNELNYINPMTFMLLKSLEVLHLEGNQLTTYPIWDLRTLPNLNQLFVARNPLSCNCDYVKQFQDFASTSVIIDLGEAQCFDNGRTVNLGKNITCSDALAVTLLNGVQDHFLLSNIIPILFSILAVIVFVVCIVIIVFVFRTPMRVWLHAKYGIRVLDACSKSAEDRLYDAFVSYTIKDEDFVQQVLLPSLEQDEPSYRLCLQHRDLPHNAPITDSFPGIASLCSRHVLVVSKTYLESEWKEVKFAMQDTKRLTILIILLDELTTLDLAAAPEFNLLLKTAQVVKWSENGFWNKIRFYLPDPKLRAYRRGMQDKTNLHTANIALHSSPKPSVTGTPNKYNTTWHYDGLNSSASTRNNSNSSPRTLSQGSSSSTSTEATNTATATTAMSTPIRGNVQTNPLSNQWHSSLRFPPQPQQDHTYQSIEPIYHTLEPSSASQDIMLPQQFDTLGKLDVMLPNGQFVPATLVRNHANGRLFPVVDVNSQTLPGNSGSGSVLAQTSGFGRSDMIEANVNRKIQTPKSARAKSNGNRYFV